MGACRFDDDDYCGDEVDAYYDELDEGQYGEIHSLDNMCVEPGCLEDGRFGSCGCCGGPLCFMHEEILCGFCTECTSSPVFGKRMAEIYGEDCDPILDNEIPF